MEFNRGAVVGWAAGVCGGAAALAAVLATFAGQGWRVVVIVLAVIAGLGLVLLIWTGFQPASAWFKERWRLRQQRKEPSPRLITDRWRYTPAAFDVGTLANLGTRAFSNHAYLQPSEKLPPSVRVGAFVACSSLEGDEPTAEYLRSRMREFLGQPEVMGLISMLTDAGADAEWHSQPGNGRFNLEADLLDRDGGEQPLASAQLLLPEQGIMRYGHDRRGAELYLHIALPLKDGAPVKCGIVEWGEWFTAALTVPGLLARFLDGIGITTSGEPTVRSAVQVRSRVTAATGVDELIDFGDLPVLLPRKYSMQFDGWVVADQQGKAASAVSKRFLTELCESTGRTGYEIILAGLDGGTHQQDEESEPTSGTP